MVQQAAQLPPEGDGYWAEQRVPVVWMAATDAKGLLAPGDGLSAVPVWVYACTAYVCVPYYVSPTAGDVLEIHLGPVRITVVLMCCLFGGKCDVSLLNTPINLDCFDARMLTALTVLGAAV